MAASDQAAANSFISAFGKAKDLHKRIWFTLGALIVFRLGTYLPLPGIDTAAFGEFFQERSGGVLDMFNVLSGGALSRMTVFSLNIMPYVSASIIIQLLSSVVPSLETLRKEGDSGRKKLNQYTRYLTVLIALVQGYGLAVGLESIGAQAQDGVAVVPNPGLIFQLTATVTLLTGTLFLMWLGEQITSRGLGNGISLLIFAGIVAELPAAAAQALTQASVRQQSLLVLGLLLGAVLLIAFIVYVEQAQRRIPIQYPKRQVGQGRMVGGELNHMPLKLNTAGVIPPIFASSILLLPLTIVNFTGDRTTGPQWLQDLTNSLQHGQPLYMLLYVALIVFFVFFYTAIVFNPQETAENLRKAGGYVPGYRPGQSTADYLDRVLTRISVLGAAYIAFICVLPELLISQAQLPFYFGGTSLLIVVSVTIDTRNQIFSHLIAKQYEGLLRRSRSRGGRTR